MGAIQLQKIASIVQGVNFTRLETTEESIGAQRVKVLTLKEFNESMGLPYRLAQDKKASIWIEQKKLERLRFTEENGIIIHLLSQRVASIPSNYKGLLIPSNFVSINFKEPVDAKFVEWYFNEHAEVRRQFKLATQGSSVSSLSISMLREMEVSLPPIQLQTRIGKIVQAVQQKKGLWKKEWNWKINIFMNCFQ